MGASDPFAEDCGNHPANLRSQYPPIKAIRYDPAKQIIVLDHIASPRTRKKTAPAKKKPQTVIEVEDWLFLPGKGFFPLSLDPSLGREYLEKEEIGPFIDKHPELALKKLEKTGIDFAVQKVNYQLSFVAKKGLRISAYLFSPGDLEEPQVARFGSWIYLPKKGFVRAETFLFPQVAILVPIARLSEFIERHRLWLNNYEGFQIHQATVESALTFFRPNRDFAF